jgi:putative transposase
MGGIARERNMLPVAIGGFEDHCHALLTLPSSVSVPKAAQYLKGGSSIWLSRTFAELEKFEWQKGYGAFSVSISHVPATVAYIRDQEAHHGKQSFEEEYSLILQKHHLPFDPKAILGED